MSALRRFWPSRRFLVTIVTSALVYLASYLFGWGDWIRQTPIAVAVIRVLAILFFGGGGLLLLFGGRYEPEFKSISYRLPAILLLLLATLNAVLLFNGEATFSALFSE